MADMMKIEDARVIYLSEPCLVINKLPGEAVEGAGAGMVNLPVVLAEQFGGVQAGGGLFFPTAIHRLDVPVSGCVLFARTSKARSVLNTAFAEGRVEKHYWAIIEMPPPAFTLPETGELVHWLITDTKRNKTIAYTEDPPHRHLKKAVLRYRIRGRGIRYLFLEIELLTGGHHQIRAQLARLGLHIKGDLKYGARRGEKNGGIRLHAYSLAFPNPAIATRPSTPGDRVQVTALPPVRDALWEAFADMDQSSAMN
ncbi:MAG: RNA pseudouridine synthase [Treponema sp.]|jgi:23S rRNA pseudouridine1911/1915/1917 synthase|nr:RNA pseudouridine synthase [Treponema sp.]